jgi:Flp pilus assembly protein TadG
MHQKINLVWKHPMRPFVKLKKLASNEDGSISILIVGLFAVVLVTSLVLTDISAVYMAKRNLTLASEAAAQQGVKNLDKAAYYKGEFNTTRQLLTFYHAGQDDPGIPIDCNAGHGDVSRVLESWNSDEEIVLSAFQCDGYQIAISTSSRAVLPIPIPFTSIDHLEIESHVSTIDERAKTNNFSGLNIGH